MLRLQQIILLALLLMVVASCGGQNGFTSTGYVPPYGAYAPLPPTGYPYPTPFINPSMPGGYPTSFAPFAPVYNYFQQTPWLQSYWGSLWPAWQQYASSNGYGIYEFTPFWTWCQSGWSNTQLYQLYVVLNSGYYNSCGCF
jgi:hypothetical protein